MKKQIMETIQHISHLHLHFGVWIAVAAIMITALHTSSDMIYALYGMQPAFAEAGNHTLREAREFETHTGHAQISMVRRNHIGGS